MTKKEQQKKHFEDLERSENEPYGGTVEQYDIERERKLVEENPSEGTGCEE